MTLWAPMRTFRPSVTPRPRATCGPIATGSLHVTPGPITAVACTPGVQGGVGYSTARTASSAVCGSGTMTRAAGPAPPTVLRDGRHSVGGSLAMPLPDSVARLIRERGLEVGHAMDELTGQRETKHGDG